MQQCTIFVSTYGKDRCKNCNSLKHEHEEKNFVPRTRRSNEYNKLRKSYNTNASRSEKDQSNFRKKLLFSKKVTHNIVIPEKYDVIHEGDLRKRSRQNRHRWQRRFYQLIKTDCGDFLRYTKNKEECSDHTLANRHAFDCKNIIGVKVRTKGKGADDGCRFFLETKEDEHQQADFFELLTSSAVECKKWTDILSTYCGGTSEWTDDHEKKRQVEELIPAHKRLTEQNKCNVLVAIMDGDFIALKKAILSGPISSILQFFPIIANIIHEIPFWFKKLSKELIDALSQRLKESRALQQCLAFHRMVVQEEFKLAKPGELGELDKGNKNVVAFFQQLIEKKYQAEGACLEAKSDLSVFHPFDENYGEIENLNVERIFKSNARPLLLSCSFRNDRSTSKPAPMVIFKSGDDLQQDIICLLTFRLVNYLWAKNEVKYGKHPVMAFVYGVVATGPNMGFIEFLKGCESISFIKRVTAHNFNPSTEFNTTPNDDGTPEIMTDERMLESLAGASEEMQRMLASAAGAYIAAFILGVRDRHYDNILIRRDGLLFHIDFGHVLGDTVTMDAAAIAITPELHAEIGDRWPCFVKLCEKAYQILRAEKKTLIQYVNVLFASLKTESIQPKAEQFLSKSLQLSMDDKDAAKWLREQINRSPQNTRTRFKNAMHRLATRGET